MSIESLFEPLKIKNLLLKNRFVMAPMSRYQNNGGIPNDDFIEYHRLRAAGELGLTITGATAVDRIAANNHPKLANINESSRAGWEKVVRAVHAEESPSGLEAPDRKVGEPMTDKQIADCIEAFARAALMAMEIGFDTVEIHAAHGFLLDEFFWDATNRRQDQWGGKTLMERSRFVVEVIRAVKAVIEPEAPLLLRISQWKEQDYGVKLVNSPSELEAWLTPMLDAGVDARILERLTQGPDHPVALNFPEGEYLKGLICQVD